MPTLDAARILNLSADATPEQIESAFRAQRGILEEKVARAPTEGLKEKYRDAIYELTTARNRLLSLTNGEGLPTKNRPAAAAHSTPRSTPALVSATADVEPSIPQNVATAPQPVATARRSGLRRRLPFVVALAIVGAAAYVGWLRIESANAPLLLDAPKFMADWDGAKDLAPPEGYQFDDAGDEWWSQRTHRELLHLAGRSLAAIDQAAKRHDLQASQLLDEFRSSSSRSSLQRSEIWHRAQAHLNYGKFLREALAPDSAYVSIEEFRRAVVWFEARAASDLRHTAEYDVRRLITLVAESAEPIDLTTDLTVTSNPSGASFTITSEFGDGETLVIRKNTPFDEEGYFGAGDAEIRVKHPGKPDFDHRFQLGRGKRVHADFIDPRKSDYN